MIKDRQKLPDLVRDPGARCPDPVPCAGAGLGSAEGSGAGLAAGWVAGVPAAGSPDPVPSPALFCTCSLGRILTPQWAAAAEPL